eukprot:CAMPEP_0170209278 /NCGR_PEP_ID=MMETSP0116_2-20130129/4227_1 /TAXON_ID=400756 /ORGANISM="Durinskia baltica, Strain CSIRO CS-38" /LENGTH=514 /DNA_ID=CAMNT_0010459757 /DNA_START=33 /DNA_END=1575 /DNA_ORIENTATION=-
MAEEGPLSPPSGWVVDVLLEDVCGRNGVNGSFQLRNSRVDTKNLFLSFHGIVNSFYFGINYIKLFDAQGEEVGFDVMAVDGSLDLEGSTYTGPGWNWSTVWWCPVGEKHSLLLALDRMAAVKRIELLCANAEVDEGTGRVPTCLVPQDVVGGLNFAIGDAPKELKVSGGGSLSLDDAAAALASGDLKCHNNCGFRTFFGATGGQGVVMHSLAAQGRARAFFGQGVEVPKDMMQVEAPPEARCIIPQAERRAMLLSELQALRCTIVLCCVSLEWADFKTGEPLAPEEVDLYRLNYHQLCPQTAAGGVVLHGLALNGIKVGDRVVQPNPFGDAIGEVQELLKHNIIGRSRDGDNAVKVRMKKGRFSEHGDKPADIIIGGEPRGAAARVEYPGSCSYKELHSEKPTWFTSHWWGESVLAFIRCCERHAELRKLKPDEAGYWVCGYANRQHDLGADLSIDPSESSFSKALMRADGAVLILDERATAFSRIWCDFEMYTVIRTPGKMLDIATIDAGEAY